MTISFRSFASSSSGNCSLVKSENSQFLVDVGISGKKIMESLSESQTNLDNITGIFLTHEHIDHVKSIRMISKKAKNAKVYASRGTFQKIDDLIEPSKKVIIDEESHFQLGDIQVSPFALSHDANEPLGYAFSKEDKKLTIVTDTGCITEGIFNQMKDSDIIILEANHEENILRMGRYPFETQQRILSDLGHLSNVSTGECMCKVIEEYNKEKPIFVLAHMSSENNTPKQAYLTVRNILQEKGYYRDKDFKMDILGKDALSCCFEV